MTKICMLVTNSMVHDIRVHKEALALSQAGFEVHVVALWQAGLLPQEQQGSYMIHRVRMPHRSLFPAALIRKTVNLLSQMRQQLRLAQAARSLQADVYHAHDLDTLPAACLAARGTLAQVVYDSHEIYYEQDPQQYWLKPVHKLLWRTLEGSLLPRTNVLITVNESFARFIEKAHPSLQRSFHIVMNCSWPYKTPDPATRQALRQRLGIPAQRKVLVFHGTIGRARGIAPLIQAMAHVRQEALLYFLVQKQTRPELQEMADQAGVAERVRIEDYVPMEELQHHLDMADIGLIPYENACLNHYYCTPNKLFDFISVGIPIIASDMPELRKVVARYEVGRLLPSLEPGAIAQEINALLDAPQLYEKYKKNMQQAQADFNWDNEAQKLLQLYRGLGNVISKEGNSE